MFVFVLAVAVLATAFSAAFINNANAQAASISVPFHQQETFTWCGPAALQMVLEYWGTYKTQTEIAATVIDKITNGTTGAMMQNYPKTLGFNSTTQYYTTIQVLEHYVKQKIPVIVAQYIASGVYTGHYRVVVGYDNAGTGTIITLDPITGIFPMSFNLFTELWAIADNWTLAITPNSNPTLSPAPTAVPTPILTPTPTHSPWPISSPSLTPIITPTLTPNPSTPTPTQSAPPSPLPSRTATPIQTPVPTITPTPSLVPTVDPTSPVSSLTSTPLPTQTSPVSLFPTEIPTTTPTAIPTSSPIISTPISTPTTSAIPTISPQPNSTADPTNAPTPTTTQTTVAPTETIPELSINAAFMAATSLGCLLGLCLRNFVLRLRKVLTRKHKLIAKQVQQT